MKYTVKWYRVRHWFQLTLVLLFFCIYFGLLLGATWWGWSYAWSALAPESTWLRPTFLQWLGGASLIVYMLFVLEDCVVREVLDQESL